MRILIVTDAWYPQINGVVRTLTAMRDNLREMGDTVEMLTPEGFKTLPCPTYPEIRLSLVTARTLDGFIRAYGPDVIHIATEGPLGLAARHWCAGRGVPYTTAFHTRFPEYLAARFRIPIGWTYPGMRWFHKHAQSVMAPTLTVVESLQARGFANVRLWGRGVDTDLFKPGRKAKLDVKGPVLLYVGRVAVEKNIEEFLTLAVSGTKVVVGDGPMLSELKTRFPYAHFAGAKHGTELVGYFNAADVFVFPSRTDTFGLVMLEALACGVPVAAFPVMGPKDVITEPTVGCLSENLADAVRTAAKHINSADCRRFAETRSWRASAVTFRSYLHPFDPARFGAARVGPADAAREPIGSG